jgi:hypothetical protein
MCLRILLGKHQRVCITKLSKLLYPTVQCQNLNSIFLQGIKYTAANKNGYKENTEVVIISLFFAIFNFLPFFLIQYFFQDSLFYMMCILSFKNF